MSAIQGYHAHVYYDPSDKKQARLLCEEARNRFGIAMGRMHDGPVGPHPRGSCQLSIPPERFGEVMPWLIANRRSLTVFAHALTGDDLKDHTEQVIWLGPSEALKLDAL